MRRAIDCLRDCADLALVDPATLEAPAAGAVHSSLPTGSLLFESGSAPDGVYLVANGRLGVKTPAIARREARLTGQAPGEVLDPFEFRRTVVRGDQSTQTDGHYL